MTHFGAFNEESPPGSRASHDHWHANEDEMVLILDSTLTLTENGTQTMLHRGGAACWRAGDPVAHSQHNRSDTPARDLVIGARVSTDAVTYPDLDRVLHYDKRTDRRLT